MAGQATVQGVDRVGRSPHGHVWKLTADSVTSAFDVITAPSVVGWFAGIDFKFGSPAPSDIIVNVTTIDGILLIVNATLAATGRIKPDSGEAEVVSNGVIITVTGNDTVSAVLDVIVNALSEI